MDADDSGWGGPCFMTYDGLVVWLYYTLGSGATWHDGIVSTSILENEGC